MSDKWWNVVPEGATLTAVDPADRYAVFEGDPGQRWTVDLWSDDVIAPVGPADGHWVVDAIEPRAWGPFDSLADAEAFQQQDKYLSGSCIIRDGAPDRWRLYPPEVYPR